MWMRVKTRGSVSARSASSSTTQSSTALASLGEDVDDVPGRAAAGADQHQLHRARARLGALLGCGAEHELVSALGPPDEGAVLEPFHAGFHVSRSCHRGGRLSTGAMPGILLGGASRSDATGDRDQRPFCFATAGRCTGKRLEEPMDKPRIFLGSSGKQEKLLQALTRGLSDIAHVEPWMTSFNPGTSTLERLLELTQGLILQRSFLHRTIGRRAVRRLLLRPTWARASPRDNVVFEAGLFGGVLGNAPNLHPPCRWGEASSDLLGLTCVRYDGAVTPSEMRTVNQKIRKAIENEGRVTRIEGSWWHFSLTERTAKEPDAISLLKISRDRNGALELTGRMARGWKSVGKILERGGKGEDRLPASSSIGRASGRWIRTAAAGGGVGEIRLESGPRIRLLHDSRGCQPECQHADSRCLVARGSPGHQHSGRSR